jgi:RNA polymerase sigma factor (sigma-70 family)
MMKDRSLIEAYAEHGSESAFAELTRRYEGLVFAAALRQVGDADLARDVVQNVFLCVGRKARALCQEPILAGWLSRAARLEALKLLRDRRRRMEREQEFCARTLEAHSSTGVNGSAAEAELRHAVNLELEGLAVEDRRALVLRFRDGKSLKGIAAFLGISEDAAQKRVSRALERLRSALGRKGVSRAGLATLLGGSAFSATTTASAMLAAPAAGASFLITLTPILAMTKIKLVAITCAVAALTAVPLAIRYLQGDEVQPSLVSAEPARRTMELRSSEARELEAARAEIAALQAEIVALRSAGSGLAPEEKPAGEAARAVAPEPDSMAALRQRALNPQNDPRDRMMALRELRERNGRDPEVVAAMAALARAVAEPDIRADIFRQLHGAKDPALKLALLEAARGDASEEVREEAAETLGDYASDPAVQAVLATVSRGDVDLKVRAEAAKALAENAPAEVLRRMQSDPQATEMELYHSTSALRKREGANAAQAALLVNVLKATTHPDLRKDIVKDLGKHYEGFTEVREWMDHLAETEPDAKVRKEAAKYSSKPGR